MSGNYPTGDPNGPGQANPYGGGQPQGSGQQGSGQPAAGQPGFGQPSGPSYGGPGGAPGQPGPYGTPPQQPGQPYGGPGQQGTAPPGQQGGPGYPGQPGGPGYPGQPGGPGYPGPYGGPTGPTGPKKSSKLPLIIGAAVLALVIIGVGAGVLANSRSKGASAGDPAGPAAPQSSAATVAGKPSDAVKTYLEALAASNAAAALAISDEQPADKTFLTDAVLADSNSRAPLTDINVPEVVDEYAYSIDATYKLGEQAVSEKFSVKKAGAGWKLRDAVAELNLTTIRAKTLPMTINKVAVKTDKIRIFPGSYKLDSGSSYISYGDEPLLLQSPSDYPSTADLQPALTAAGSKAFEAAMTSKLKTCLAAGDLSPTGCPNKVKEASYQKVDDDSVRWKLDGNPMANVKPRLDYQNPAIAEASMTVSFDFSASGTSFDRKADFSTTVTRYVSMRADMTQEPLKASFEN